MKYFSMFSGIGGFELGIQQAFDVQPKDERLQMEADSGSNNSEQLQRTASCIGYSEIDKYAIKVYERQFNGEDSRLARKRECDCGAQGRQETLDSERGGVSQVNGDLHHDTDCASTESDNYGGHTNYGDATTIDTDTLPDFDLLVGGFPCQAFSVAGKRGGFNDTRGTLFFSIARILADKKPRHLLLENVKGLLSHDSGKTFQTIIGVLADLGYSVEWQILNSKDFGVPQNRERVFIVGHLGGGCGRQVFPILGTNGKDIVQLNQPRHSNDRVYSDEGTSPTLNTMQGGRRQPFVAPVLTPDRAEKRQNGRRMKNDGEPSFTLTGQDKHGVAIKEATTKGYDIATEGDSINYSQPNSKTRRGRVGKGVANTLDTSTDQATLQDTRIRRLTPRECERLQGFPDDWTAQGWHYCSDNGKDCFPRKGECMNEGCYPEDISDTQRYKMCGNAVTVNVIEAIIKNFRCL